MAKEKKIKEPSMIVRPIGGLGGLDNLHVTLIIVIALLFALLLAVSYSKPILITNSTQANNTTATSAQHTASQIQTVASRVLASYSTVNSSLSLLPFISNVSGMKETYMPALKAWYVSLSARNFGSNLTFAFSFLISDTNTSKVTPLIQAPVPSRILDNTVAEQGVVQLNGKYSCVSTTPTQVYWFIDPYATGAVSSLVNASGMQSKFGGKVNVTMRIVFGSDTQRVANSYGLLNAEYLGKYVYCASQQRNFSVFASDLNSVYASSYVPQSVLSNIANYSNLDTGLLNGCIANSTQTLSTQALLASYYNITETPVEVVNCHYLSIPQTVNKALCYSDNSLC